MAASIGVGEKLSKSERKALKKQNKARHILFKHDGIQTSKFPTSVSKKRGDKEYGLMNIW